MKKRILLIAFIAGFMVTNSVAQEYELAFDESPGYIITSKGKKVDGYLDLSADKYPWYDQEDIKFFTEEATKDGKVKNREKEKYDPKDIKGYYTKGFYYESMKYSNMSAVGPAMLPKWYFLKRLVDGKMSIYKFYEKPMQVGESSAVEADTKRALNNPHIVIFKEGDKKTEKLKNVKDIDILEYISDCEYVKKKYLDGGYGIKPMDNEEKKGVKGFVSRVVDANVQAGYIEEIAKDYNENCN